MDKKLTINVQTGEKYYEDYSPEELLEREKEFIRISKLNEEEAKENEKKEKLKQSAHKKLSALGLTADEIQALIG